MSAVSAFGLRTRQDVMKCVSKFYVVLYGIVSSVSTIYCTYVVFIWDA